VAYTNSSRSVTPPIRCFGLDGRLDAGPHLIAQHRTGDRPCEIRNGIAHRVLDLRLDQLPGLLVAVPARQALVVAVPIIVIKEAAPLLDVDHVIESGVAPAKGVIVRHIVDRIPLVPMRVVFVKPDVDELDVSRVVRFGILVSDPGLYLRIAQYDGLGEAVFWLQEDLKRFPGENAVAFLVHESAPCRGSGCRKAACRSKSMAVSGKVDSSRGGSKEGPALPYAGP